MNKIKLIALIAGLFTAQASFASSHEKSSKEVINRLITYANYGNGDVFVSLPTNGEICSYGYYINKESSGYQSNLSMLLAAYQSQTKVVITGLSAVDKRWNGSGNPVCEMYSVEYKR